MSQLQREKQEHSQKISAEWEESVQNLKQSLEQARSELTQKEFSQNKIQRDLKNKLTEIEATREQKSNLMRKLEDAQAELLNLKKAKDEKDAKLQQ